MSVTALALVALLAARPAAAAPGTRIEKLARILALEDRRSLGDGELDRLLSDPDRGVRRRAALAAGRVADPALVPSLIARMNDQEPEVRQMVAFALGLIGDPLGSERLVLALGDPEPIVRARAAEALGRVGGPRAAPELVRFILAALPKEAPVLAVRGDDPGSGSDPWLPTRLALFALVRLKDAGAAEQALLNGGKPRFDWWAATWAAMRLESPRLKPVLLAAATSNDPLSRTLAARGLGAIKDAASLDTLTALSRDQDQHVAVYALRALAAIGDARGVPAAGAALRSPDPVRVMEALKALAALPPDPALRPHVVGLVGHDEAWIRAAALPALARLDREQFAMVLSAMDPDPVWWVRASLASALAEAGDDVSLGILYGMLKDADARVLPGVLEAIRKARGPDALDTLRSHLLHADTAVRAAAAEGITALKATGLSQALHESYKRSLSDTELEARLNLVAALAEQKDAQAGEALREIAGGDPERVVRARAAAALKTLGQPAPWPGHEPRQRPAYDYREAMRPYEPLPGVPLYTPRAILHTRHGKLELHLNIVEAPLTCLSFVELARAGFFDGLSFHRVVPGFVVQGGDPRGDGSGGPGYTLRDEIGQRPYGRGVVGMALAGRDTGGSQFFITLSPQPHLDGGYTVFGAVAEGMEVVDKIRQGDLIERVEIWTGR